MIQPKEFTPQLITLSVTPHIRYKLDVEVEDPTGTLNLMIFDEQARRLVGVAAEDLVEDVTDENRCTVPDAVSRICGSTHFFEVILKNRGFVMKWIFLDEDELMLLEQSGSDKMTVGCGGLFSPKGECYPSVSSCSSQLTEV